MSGECKWDVAEDFEGEIIVETECGVTVLFEDDPSDFYVFCHNCGRKIFYPTHEYSDDIDSSEPDTDTEISPTILETGNDIIAKQFPVYLVPVGMVMGMILLFYIVRSLEGKQ